MEDHPEKTATLKLTRYPPLASDGRVAPFCVEIRVPMAADTAAYVELIVAGTDRRAGTPAIFSLFVAGGRTATPFKTLHE